MKGRTPENMAGELALLGKRQWGVSEEDKGVFGATMTRISQSGMRTETVDNKVSLMEDTRRVWRENSLLTMLFLFLL